MRLPSTTSRHLFTADVYAFAITFDVGGNPVYNYQYSKTIPCTVGTDGQMRTIIVYTDEEFVPFTRLANIKDRDGSPVYASGKELTVNNSEPRLNILGRRQGFRLRCN